MKIENPFKYKLEYKALIYIKKFDKWSWTKVNAVEAKKLSTEVWTDIVTSVALSELKFNK